MPSFLQILITVSLVAMPYLVIAQEQKLNDEELPLFNDPERRVIPAPPSSEEAPPDFSIKTISTVEQEAPRAVQLVFPPHKSTLTPGYVAFEWKSEDPAKKNEFMKMDFFLERVEPERKFKLKPAKGTKRSIYCGPGNYRWRIEATPYKVTTTKIPVKNKKGKTKFKSVVKAEVSGETLKSRWRTFRVITFKSRELANAHQNAKVFDGSATISKSPDFVPELGEEAPESAIPKENRAIPFQ